MRGAIPPLLQYVFMAWCLVKHRDNFNFTLYNFGIKFIVNYFMQIASNTWEKGIIYDSKRMFQFMLRLTSSSLPFICYS
jgi:hypothetical protein